jgi:hypothetical protein
LETAEITARPLLEITQTNLAGVFAMSKTPLPDHVLAAMGEATELQLPPRGRHKLPQVTKFLGLMVTKEGFDLELESANGAVLVLPLNHASAKMVYDTFYAMRQRKLARESKPQS